MREKTDQQAELDRDIDAALSDDQGQETKAVEKGKKQRGAGLATGLSLLALAVSLAGVGGGYYLYQQEIVPLKAIPSGVEASLASSQKSFVQSKEVMAEELHQRLQDESKARLQMSETLFNEGEDLRAAFSDISDDLIILKHKANWGQREWSLAEINYLLRMAEDRLTFMRDVDTVKAALRTAARRIDLLADPVLVPLRQQLRNDLQALRAYETPDATQILTRLESMIGVLKPFPTFVVSAGEEKSPEPVAEVDKDRPSWQRAFDQARSQVEQRIRVVRHDEPLNALSHDTVARYQLEMLRLRVEALRLSLMREDGAAFRRELLAMESWVGVHLPQRQAEPIRAELQNLRSIRPFQPLPTLEASRAMLRALLSEPEFEALEDELTEVTIIPPSESVVETEPVEAPKVEHPAADSSEVKPEEVSSPAVLDQVEDTGSELPLGDETAEIPVEVPDAESSSADAEEVKE